MSKKTKSDLKIALVGASGRMGNEVRALSAVAAEISSASDWKRVSPKDIDVVLDFSTPEGLRQALAWCVKNRTPIVSGSTGLKPSDRKALQAAARKIPVLYSGNMSLGIAVMSAMLKNFRAVEDWDFQIEEVHHSKKKDRPSGTALLLQAELEGQLGRKLPEAQSLRGGGVPGIHTVWAMGPEEVVVLQHTAFNRQVFARGGLRAARWLFDKAKPGLYDLTDLYQVD